ncbi:MAG: hypothetical protein WCI05_14470, partial [Myxococcales bacterium]
WLISWQTASGIAKQRQADVARSSAAFCWSLASEMEDLHVQERLSPPRGAESPFGFFAVGSLEVPEERIRHYARARAVFDALGTLAARVTLHPDRDKVERLVDTLEEPKWLLPFQQAEEGGKYCLDVAARLTGARTPDLPTDCTVRTFDTAFDLRTRYALLFESGTRDVREDALSQTDKTAIEEMLRKLDTLEALALDDIENRVESLMDQLWSSGSDRLSAVPAIDAALKRVEDKLEDRAGEDLARRDTAPLGFEDGRGAVDKDPGRPELDSALAELPEGPLLWAMAVAAGLGAGTLGLFVAQLQEAPPPASATPAGIIPPPLVAPWSHWVPSLVRPPPQSIAQMAWIPWAIAAAALVVGVLVWSWLVRKRPRERVRRALRQRRDALYELWRTGGGGEPRLKAQAQLELRTRRLRRSALTVLRGARLRLDAIVRQILSSRDSARAALFQLGVNPPAEEAVNENLASLFQEETDLHQHLLASAPLARWVASFREHKPDVWADALVDQTWPVEWRRDDVPCADEPTLATLAAQETRRIDDSSVLSDETLVEDAMQRLAQFDGHVREALAPACMPYNNDGGPVVALDGGQILVVLPQIAGTVLSRPFRGSNSIEQVLSPSPAARVLFIRTWRELDLASIARGARVDPSYLGGPR